MAMDIYLIAVVTAVACALPGVFLVLRGETMLTDALTHSVLLGIVLGFFATENLNSPLLLIGATLMGVFTTWVIQALQQTKLMPGSAAIGVVFPLFFSVAIVLITRYAGDVHLDTDAVLMGELAFAPFERTLVMGYDIGPVALWRMVIILGLNILFLTAFYKELKIATFDPGYAAALGFSAVFIHYALMTMVSLTAVGAYDTAGSILVVGLMVGPALTGFLLTHDLTKMIWFAVAAAIFNSITGVALAFYLDVSLAGMIAAITGLTVLVTYLFSPVKGRLVSDLHYKKRRQALDKKTAEML